MKTTGRVEVFLNPSGFIEAHFIGRQSAEAVNQAVKLLTKYANKIQIKKKPVLVLLDISNLKIVFDYKAHIAATQGFKEVPFHQGAVYGPVKAQVLVNTLAMVAGVQHKVRAFSDRLEAIQWLKGGSQ